VRSVPIQNLECSGCPIEQLNQITHWLDNSNVYGSLPEVANSVRSNQDGLLKSTNNSDTQEQLPIDLYPNVVCCGETSRCALAGNLLSNLLIRKHLKSTLLLGDLRVNEQPPLGAMHTLFLREHNRVARELKQLNAGWKHERLFQESRRVVNAQFQHIVYNEFLPILIGKKSLIKFGLSPLTKGFSPYYK
jgi:peroxidase